MGDYRTLEFADLPNGLSPARRKLELDEAAGASTFGCNLYEADPGEQLPWGYHRHPDHEELFVVLSGELTVDTPDGPFVLGPDEALFVPRDHRNRARATGEEPVRVLAVGAPKERDRAVIEEECPDCGTFGRLETTVDATEDGGRAAVVSCGSCGATVRRF
jgi:mannose-6-phosphate isomerase-like protein (cupin superfamily)